MRPIMCLRSVLLPQPLPPMMTKTSPCWTTKSRSRWITKLPYAIVRPATWMRGAAPEVCPRDPARRSELPTSPRDPEGRPGCAGAPRATNGGYGGRPEPSMSSKAEDMEDHREDPVEDDQAHDRRHHGRGRGQADR